MTPVFTLSISRAGRRGFMLPAITLYLKHKQTYAKRAGESYSKTMERLYAFSRQDPKSLRKEDVNSFCDYLKEELPKKSRGDWHTTYAYSITILKDFLKYHDNPVFKSIKIPAIKWHPHHPVSREEFDLICDYLDTETENFANLQKLLVVRLLFETGCRISELLNIEWRSIVNPELFIENKKNQDSRWVFWSGYTHSLLLKFIDQRKFYNGESLFTTYEGKMSIRCVQRFLRIIGGYLSLPYHLSPHCFRQGKAHDLFKQGADIKTVCVALGHHSLKSTERYLVLEKDEIRGKLINYL